MTTLQPPANIHAAVESVAMQYGVPDGIWEDVAYVESGYNPNPSPSGPAYGLFQLQVAGGGQGADALAQGYTIADLEDPAINAKIAMPSIAKAWSSLKGSFSSQDVSWWQKFAAQSGHPASNGNVNDQAVVNEAQKLMTNFITIEYGVISDQGLQAGVNADKAVPANAASSSNPLDSITGFVTNIGWLQQHWQSGLIKIGIFIGALILLGVGLFVVVR